MHKKVMIGMISFVIVILAGVNFYFYSNRDTALSKEEKTRNEETITEDNPSTTSSHNKKSLIVYFSVPETDDPNKEMTTEEENSAIVVEGEVLGNTQYAAMLIAENTGGDLYRIEPETPYTTNHEELVALAREEQNEDARPKIKTTISNFDDYDVIYVGYPIWWSDMPQIMYTFFELYDFSGKTVIPFSTHGGSGLAGTVTTIQNKLRSAIVETNAFTMSRDDMEQAPGEIQAWLDSIGK